MKLYIITPAHLEQLKANINGNLGFYQESPIWVPDHFDSEMFCFDSRIEIPDIQLDPSKSDLDNSMILYSGFKKLNLTQASDERLWAYLSHVTFWGYMRERWPVEKGKKNPVNFVKNRYFFMGDRHRALLRHGIARLWWFAHETYDVKRADPFELTKMLLFNQDISLQLLDRTVSRVNPLTRVILSSLSKRLYNGDRMLKRKQFRHLVKLINWQGGLTVLDSLSLSDLELLVNDLTSKI